MKKVRNNLILLIVATTFLLVGCTGSNQERLQIRQTYPFSENLRWGNYEVGFQSFNEIDFGRGSHSSEDGKRRVSFGLWYPAIQQGNEERMFYIDYLKIFEGRSLDSIKMEYLGQKNFLGEMDSSILNDNLSIRTSVLRGAQPVAESFPLIIYAGRANDFIYGNSFLFEYLASNGYAVLSLPPKPIIDENESMPLNNLNDIHFAINHVKNTMPMVDISNMATIAYEVGGVSAVALTIANPNIKGHISLQGAVGSWFGWTFSKSLYNNNLSYLKDPILHFGSGPYEKETTFNMGESTFETADSIYNSKRYFSFLDKSVPLGVSSHLIMSWVQPLVKVKDEYKIDKDEIINGYEDMVLQTLMFLNTYVKNEEKVSDLEQMILSNHKNNFIKRVE